MIRVENLTKQYGDFTAVDQLSFTIEEGHVYGFLGPNGAGKSTTMNIMTGCLSASEGTVKINGFDIFEEPDKAKKQIGYLPEHPPLYMNETPYEYLKFVGEAKGLKKGELSAQIEDVIEKTKIQDVLHKKISALSKGYKQRVGIAQALLGSPKIIILDEPTVGLDPIQIIEIRSLIKELGKTHTIIFSSHILSEVQTICDQILMISKGKLVAYDTPENLEKKFLSSHEIMLTIDGEARDIIPVLTEVDGVNEIEILHSSDDFFRCVIHLNHESIYDSSKLIYRSCAKNSLDLLEMTLKKGNLEDVFIELAEASQQSDEEAQKEEM